MTRLATVTGQDLEQVRTLQRGLSGRMSLPSCSEDMRFVAVRRLSTVIAAYRKVDLGCWDEVGRPVFDRKGSELLFRMKAGPLRNQAVKIEGRTGVQG